MQYNFDEEINRQGTNSIKWEYTQSEKAVFKLDKTDQFFGDDRMLPMWIADMDFRSPQPVVDALVERAQHGVYGYTEKPESYFDAIVDWMKNRHGWRIKPSWITTTPGVVPALAMLVRTFVKPGDKLIIQPPVYYPFYLVAEFNGVELVKNPLIYEDGYYQMDFEDLEAKARDPKVKMLILCNPHNPVGRVWSKSELSRMSEICLANKVRILSDEIHGDLTFSGANFIPTASISREIAQNSFTCTAPSKTFNLAGLATANVIIPNADLRARFERTLLNNALIDATIFGSVALEAAYKYGAEWLDQLLLYLEGNLDYLENFIAENIPQIRVVRPEGTYLVWLDCRPLGLDKGGLKRLMHGAGVYLEDGNIFGAEGDGFQRMNIACPRALLVDGLERIRRAVESHVKSPA